MILERSCAPLAPLDSRMPTFIVEENCNGQWIPALQLRASRRPDRLHGVIRPADSAYTPMIESGTRVACPACLSTDLLTHGHVRLHVSDFDMCECSACHTAFVVNDDGKVVPYVRATAVYALTRLLLDDLRLQSRIGRIDAHESTGDADILWLEHKPEDAMCEGEYIGIEQEGADCYIFYNSANSAGGDSTHWSFGGSDQEAKDAILSYLARESRLSSNVTGLHP